MIPQQDELLQGEPKPYSFAITPALEAEIEKARALDGYGGSKKRSAYVRLLLVAALRRAEEERKALRARR